MNSTAFYSRLREVVESVGGRLHYRSAWWDGTQPAVTGPTMLPFGTEFYGHRSGDDAVIHYPGHDRVPDGDIGEFIDDYPGYLRKVHAGYLNRTDANGNPAGYSVGYNFDVDWLGGLWILRGVDFKNAANLGRKLTPVKKWNGWSVSAHLGIDSKDRPTDECCRAVAALVFVLREFGAAATIRPHNHGDYTGCPGQAQTDLELGRFEPAFWGIQQPEPEPEPEPEEEAVRSYIAKHKNHKWILVDGPHCREAISVDLDESDADLGGHATIPPGREIKDPYEYRVLALRAGLPDPYPHMATGVPPS